MSSRPSYGSGRYRYANRNRWSTGGQMPRSHSSSGHPDPEDLDSEATWFLTINTNVATSPMFNAGHFSSIIERTFDAHSIQQYVTYHHESHRQARSGVALKSAVLRHVAEVGDKKKRVHAHVVLVIKHESGLFIRLDYDKIRSRVMSLVRQRHGLNLLGVYVHGELIKDTVLFQQYFNKSWQPDVSKDRYKITDEDDTMRHRNLFRSPRGGDRDIPL